MAGDYSSTFLSFSTLSFCIVKLRFYVRTSSYDRSKRPHHISSYRWFIETINEGDSLSEALAINFLDNECIADSVKTKKLTIGSTIVVWLCSKIHHTIKLFKLDHFRVDYSITYVKFKVLTGLNILNSLLCGPHVEIS